MPKKVQKNKKNIFFVLNKYQSVKHVSTSIFQGLFRNIFSRSVALDTNKLWAIIDFFFKDRTFCALYPTLCIKKKTNFSKKDKKNYKRGPKRPPPRLFMAKNEETNFFRTCLYGYQKSALGCSFSTFLSFQY